MSTQKKNTQDRPEGSTLEDLKKDAKVLQQEVKKAGRIWTQWGSDRGSKGGISGWFTSVDKYIGTREVKESPERHRRG